MIESVVIIGTGKLPLLCAQEVIEKNINCRVLEYGEYTFSMLEIMCGKLNINYSHMSKQKLTDFLLEIQEMSLIISANNTYLFPVSVLQRQNLLIINFHPALLPSHPGRNAEAWAIFEQDEKTGITWHFVDERVDHGDIIIQREIILDYRMTSLKLMMLQIKLGYECLKIILPQLLATKDMGEDVDRTKQNKQEEIKLSKTIPNEGILECTWEINQISAFLRAMDYGKMNVMGSPKCIIGEETYCWDRYVIKEDTVYKRYNIKSGIFEGDNIRIELINFRKDI